LNQHPTLTSEEPFGIYYLGMTGMFDRLIKYIPSGIAAGLLAGILLEFGIAAFGGAEVDPILVILLFIAYIIFKQLIPRFVVILAVGFIYLILFNKGLN